MFAADENSENEVGLTLEQRLEALERNSTVLNDTVKMLHKILKEQGELITEYITQKIVSADSSGQQQTNVRPEDAVYTFRCKQRFDKIEDDIDKLRKSIEDAKFKLKAS
jgi:ubiquinone biosynthesis protein UbiJ